METQRSSLPNGPARPGVRSRVWWLVPRPFDLVSSLLYLGVALPFLYSFFTGTGYTPPLVWWQVALMLLCIAALLVMDRLEYRFYDEHPPREKAAALLLARIALIEVVCWLDQFKYSPFLYLIVLFLTCLYFGSIAGYGMGLLAWVVYWVKHTFYGPGWLSNGTELHYLVLFTLGCVFAIAVAGVVARERAGRAHTEELLAELERSHQQLREYAAQAEELATVRERNRLARDIHDSLGHYLTGINVQLEKALTFRDRRPQEADQAVSDAKHLASEALQDVRRSVGALRTNRELPAFVPSVQELVERARSEQCTVELEIEGCEEGVSPQRLLALYRAAQEGLTNIQKHAAACHVRVEVRFGEREALLRLCDDGRGFDPTAWQRGQAEGLGGYGLLGTQERLGLVGGRLEIKSAPGKGTTLLVSVPLDE